MAVIPQIGVGIQTGAALTHYKRIEDSILAGGNTPTSALFQTFQLGYLDSHISRTLEVTGTETLPFYARAVVILTPIALALGIKYYVTDPEWRTFLFSVQKQVGNLCQVIAVVCSVAMIYFGSVILGATSLAMLGIGLLDRKGMLPEKMRQLIHEYSNPLIVCTGLIFGSRFEMIFAGLNFIALCVDKYFDYLDKQEVEEALKNEIVDNLSYSELQDILNDKVETEVNTDYIYFSTLPPIPNVDFEELNTMFDEIDWDTHIGVLRAELKGDKKFEKEVGDISKKSDEFLIDYARGCLKDFLTSVKERAILDGEPRDYQRMEDYLKLIVSFLHKETNQVVIADSVIQLAVEGGRYCGPGKFRAAENVYQSLVCDEIQDDVPFRTKILVAIHEAHEMQLKEIYAGISQHANGKNVLMAVEVLTRYAVGQEHIKKPEQENTYGVDKAIDILIDIFFDWSDVHTYNQFVNLFGGAVGVHKASAENDSAAVIHPAISYLIKRKLKLKEAGMRYIKEVFTGHPRFIVSKALGSKRLPKTDLYEWYREWIERQEFDETTEQKLLDELGATKPKLCGKEMEKQVTSGYQDEKYKWSKTDMTIDDKVIEAMLVDMGILKIKGPKPKDRTTSTYFDGEHVVTVTKYHDVESSEDELSVSSDE